MDRIYSDGASNTTSFFVGNEIEHTPAYGMFTLFVVGVQPIDEIEYHITHHPDNIEHIFFGANHSYNPFGYDQHVEWESMIEHFLAKGIMCSLDIPFEQVEDFNESGLCEYNNFIPQLRIPIPYTKLWNYNTMVKIDDIGFNSTNPGVWSHRLDALMNVNNFTPWYKYKNDKILK